MAEIDALNYFVLKSKKLLQENGFKLIEEKNKTDFLKVTEFGYNEIQLLPALYAGHSEFGLSFSIRFDKINSITNLYNTVVESAYSRNPTFGIGLGYFGIQNENLMVDTAEQVEKVVMLLVKLLKEKVFPFFARYDSIVEMDKEFNRENRPANLYLHDVNDRPLIGLAAAALNRNPKFSYWEEYYRNRLKNASQPRKEKYEAFVKYLKDSIL